MHVVSYWWAVAGLDYYRNYVGNLQAVTREDIARYVETYIHDQPYVMGVLISPWDVEEYGVTVEQAVQWYEGTPAESAEPVPE